MNVELPDGTVIEGVPDGTSKVQLAAKLRANGLQVPAEWLTAPQQHGAEWSDVPKAFWQQTKDALGGAVRGAGSIGATMLAPHDALTQYLLERNGIKTGDLNQQRRDDMTGALQTLGADPESLTFGATKLGTEIAGTAGVGSVLGNAAARVPMLAKTGLPVALETAGMKGGSTVPRVIGGAVTGGAAAGLVDPEQAGMGAVIGGALPPALGIAGAVGQKIGRTVRGPEQAPELQAAISGARQAGYVIPPSQAKPSLVNRTLEGFSGKLTTAQNASAKNQAITNRLAAEALGLPADAHITPNVLKDMREVAGRAYAELGSTGMITPRQPYFDALEDIARPYRLTAGAFPNAQPSPVLQLVESLRSPAFASAAAVEKIKHLRTSADDAFRTGNTDIGRAARAAARALEDAVEDHLTVIGEPQKLRAFREARQLIAKTYTVEKALNPASGTVDARKLAAELKKGKPLTGGIKEAAEFAAQFPKAAQAVEGMGSLPQTSPLDWWAAGGTSMMAGNPLPMLGVLARPATRAAVLGPMVQNRLIQQPGALSLDPALLQFGYRSAPVLAADR